MGWRSLIFNKVEDTIRQKMFFKIFQFVRKNNKIEVSDLHVKKQKFICDSNEKISVFGKVSGSWKKKIVYEASTFTTLGGLLIISA